MIGSETNKNHYQENKYKLSINSNTHETQSHGNYEKGQVKRDQLTNLAMAIISCQ